MKTLSIFAFFLFLNLQGYGQTITGNVQDASTGELLEYVSIGVKETPIGMITNENGQFSLDVKGQLPGAIVRVSMIGYTAETFTIAELSNKINVIKLKKTPVQLADVIVRPREKPRNVGTDDYSKRGGVCGWGGDGFGKGWEIGLEISLGERPAYLQSLHIMIGLQAFDTSLFRLHIRDIVENMPSTELLDQNIIITLTKKSGWIDIDLTPYNLEFKGDIALTLEWLKVKGVNKDRLIKMNHQKQASANVLFKLKKRQKCIFSRWGTEAKWVRKDTYSPSIYLTVQN